MSPALRCTPWGRRARPVPRTTAALLALSLGLAACAKTGPGATYYYPVAALATGEVYAYRPAPGTDGAPYYWYYRSYDRGDSLVLTAQMYDDAFTPRQFVTERIVGTGALLRDLRLYPPGEAGGVVAEVLQTAVFSFAEADPTRVLVSAVRWSQADPAAAGGVVTYTLTRNRSFARDTTYTLAGRAVAAQVWAVRELVEQDAGGTLALESRIREVYAADVGLVYRARTFPDGTVQAYALAERFAMDSLIARAGQGLPFVPTLPE